MTTAKTAVSWRKSKRCDTTACIEVAMIDSNIALRDSKNPEGPVLQFTREEWDAFVAGVEAGDFVFN
ncbi:DUF397 domain-containing protein [Catellatospora sp. NPDC049111]|uniref:DUF397 domain-containing protein n=1 Tax=Catellatospora sp. NPDC049111 TaxID=3155271 RepID=UPI0033EB04BF